MPNKYVNKVVIGKETKLDLTADTVTPDKLAKGITAHDKSGAPITGTSTKDADTSDATAAVAEVLNGKTFYARGAKMTGTMPNNGEVNGEISTVSGKYTIPMGFHDGAGGVTIAATEQAKLVPTNIREGVTVLGVKGSMSGSEGMKPQAKTVTPSESTQTVSPDSGYDGLSKVTVNAISSTYIGSDVTKKSAATYIPKTTDQSIASGQYLSGTQTIKGDANLVAGNIKSGVNIFGVTGTYAGGGSSGGNGNNNVEAYAITDTNPSVSFKTASGTIKIWGYGTITSSGGWGGQTTSLVAFEGDKYHKSAIYGGPSSTNLSLSISNGKLTGLPSGLSAISAIVTRGI